MFCYAIQVEEILLLRYFVTWQEFGSAFVVLHLAIYFIYRLSEREWFFVGAFRRPHRNGLLHEHLDLALLLGNDVVQVFLLLSLLLAELRLLDGGGSLRKTLSLRFDHHRLRRDCQGNSTLLRASLTKSHGRFTI